MEKQNCSPTETDCQPRKWWYCVKTDSKGHIKMNKAAWRTCSEICGNHLCHFKCPIYEKNTRDEIEVKDEKQKM